MMTHGSHIARRACFGQGRHHCLHCGHVVSKHAIAVFCFALYLLQHVDVDAVSPTETSQARCSTDDKLMGSTCPRQLSLVRSDCLLQQSTLPGCGAQQTSDSTSTRRRYVMLTMKFKPKRATTPVESSEPEQDCYHVKLQLVLRQLGVGAELRSARRRRKRSNSLDDFLESTADTAETRPTTASAENDWLSSSATSVGMNIPVKIETVDVILGHIKWRVHYYVHNGDDDPTIVLGGSINLTSLVRAPENAMKVHMCLSYQGVEPQLPTSRDGLAEGDVIGFADPPISAHVQDVELRCSQCTADDAPGFGQDTQTSSQPQALSTTATGPGSTSPVAESVYISSHTDRPAAQVSSIPTSAALPTGNSQDSTETFSAYFTSPTVPRTPQSTDAASSMMSERATAGGIHVQTAGEDDTTKTTGLGGKPDQSGAKSRQGDDDDLGVLITGKRLYVTCAAGALILILLIVIIILLVRGRRRESLLVASPDIPSAFSTLVSSTNTTSTRVSAHTPTKGKGAKADLELHFDDANATFPHLSNQCTPAGETPQEPPGYGSHYRSTSLYKPRQTQSEQNVSAGSTDDRSPSDVLFYTVAKTDKSSTSHGYTSLRAETMERRNPYANTYNAPTGVAVADTTRKDKGRKSLRSKKSLSLDVMPSKTSSLPRKFPSQQQSHDSDSDASQESDTFPQVSTSSQRIPSPKNVSSTDDPIFNGWPDFSKYPSTSDAEYAALTTAAPVPATKETLRRQDGEDVQNQLE
eukprot:scpid50276/ scgid16822/ 